MHGVEFLKKINLGENPGVSGKVVVIGGGNVAIDVARSSIRLPGVESAALYCLEPRDAMPAHEEEVEEALSEEVSIHNSWGPVRILHDGVKVTGVEFKKCTSIFDASGRFAPAYDETDTILVPCDHVLLSVGQIYGYGELLQ